MIKISVIVPFYNQEKFIEKCVLSIMNQTLKDIQIILVDDGSTDKSKEIVEALAKSDDRILILEQKNQGQGIARNYGLNYASGEFVYFLDSDDYLNDNALEVCYKNLINNSAQIITFRVKCFLDDRDFNAKWNYLYNRTLKHETVLTGQDYFSLTNELEEFYIPVWLYCFSRELLVENKIDFESYYHEDVPYILSALAVANKIVYIDHEIINRRIHQSSVMNQKKTIKHVLGYYSALVACNAIYMGLEEKGRFKKNVLKYVKNTFRGLRYAIQDCEKSEEIEKLRKKSIILAFRYPWIISFKSFVRLFMI
ncbi:glycosyltransferase family 2 protein [Priestia megaterium]|uniref:glycosyltransferase family 2 protein n=1 Tax=Priestia megaterium TaxID=1404 RepID=UPI0020A20E79|nr:glycosyltransferase [Priestia megaterium]MCP1450459.1 glycosyltransferase involved in cell wall biosynthesis [Priestia megaterium]